MHLFLKTPYFKFVQKKQLLTSELYSNSCFALGVCASSYTSYFKITVVRRTCLDILRKT
jgi:hypothetical protein